MNDFQNLETSKNQSCSVLNCPNDPTIPNWSGSKNKTFEN